jgi:phosphoribosylformylglycinamidine (FGAM) synthase-like enzyme
LAEMAFAGGLGMDVFLSEVPYKESQKPKAKSKNPRNDFILFSESNSRFIVEVERRHQKRFEAVLKGLPFGLIGCVSAGKEFRVRGLDGKECIKSDIYSLKEAWQKPLRW